MSATEQAREAATKARADVLETMRLGNGGDNDWPVGSPEDTRIRALAEAENEAEVDRYAAAIRAERDAELGAMVEQAEPTMLAHADYISRKALLTALRTPTTEATNG